MLYNNNNIIYILNTHTECLSKYNQDEKNILIQNMKLINT